MTSPLKRAIEQLSDDENPVCAYVYDLDELKRHAAWMVSLLPKNAELFYAAKANPEKRIIETLSPIVAGFEAASGGELAWLHDTIPDKQLIFGGPGKLESELQQALDTGVAAFHVESLTELKRLAALTDRSNKTAQVFLRMNIPLQTVGLTKLAMGGKPSPFGIDPSELPDMLRLIDASNGLELEGFHFHLMSHQLCVDSHLELMKLYFKTFKQWCNQYRLTLPVLNVGGGMGIDYGPCEQHFDWARFCRELQLLIEDEGMENTRLRFECGRFVTAGCGHYVMEVIDIKKSQNEIFAVGRGGTHHFRTPAAQGHSHPFRVIKGNKRVLEVINTNVTIVGQLCTPKDVLAIQAPVDTIAISDYVCFSLAGAYAWNISHQNFLMHAKPKFLFF